MGSGPNRLDPHEARLAMAVRSQNPHWKLKEIRPRHWDAVTKMAGMGEAAPLLHEIAMAAGPALEAIGRELPTEFPARVRDHIFQGVMRSVAELRA